MTNKIALSVQSHVASGYVGNRVAGLVLELNAFQLDMVNTVNFSNHTGHAVIKGEKLNKEKCDQLFEGLILNNLHQQYDYILTGYVGSVEGLVSVTENLTKILKKKTKVYVCDPVLGDNGRFYVPAECVDIYKKGLIPLSDIVTPNQFEAEILTDTKINNMEDADRACERLHALGPKVVIITSVRTAEDYFCYVSTKTNKRKIELTHFKRHLIGTGDTFSSLLVAAVHFYKENDIFENVLLCQNILFNVLQTTIQQMEAEESSPTPRFNELRLYSCIELLFVKNYYANEKLIRKYFFD